MKNYLSSLIMVLVLMSCSGQLPVLTVNKWLHQPVSRVKKIPKISDERTTQDGRIYYCVIQTADVPDKRLKRIKNQKTGEVHFEPPMGGGKYQVETRYYIENDEVVSWEILYSMIEE